MTVAELKKELENLPDESRVLIEILSRRDSFAMNDWAVKVTKTADAKTVIITADDQIED